MTGFGDLAELRRHLDTLGGERAAEPTTLVQDLEVAYEELRAAGDEVRSQQEHISALLSEQDRMRLHQEHLLAILPVPVLVTDQHGGIRATNAAAATLLRMRPGRLIGKPAFSFIAQEDRREMRTALSQRAFAQAPERHVVTLTTRDEPVTVEVTLSQHQPDVVTWVLLHSGAVRDALVEALPEALTALSTLPATASDLQPALDAAAAVIAETLGPGVEVSVSAGDPLEPRTVASSAALAQQLDGAQVMAGEGPCQTAYDTATLVESADLRTDERWPRLAGMCAQRIGAIAVPLSLGGTPLGCLNVYVAPERLDARLTEACELLAATVAGVVHHFDARTELANLATGLERAMASRAVIEQAKGIVMAARRCDADEAFGYLVDLSSTEHVKLREVARRIVASVAPS
jgi:PAS domain S-box-containing protein